MTESRPEFRPSSMAACARIALIRGGICDPARNETGAEQRLAGGTQTASPIPHSETAVQTVTYGTPPSRMGRHNRDMRPGAPRVAPARQN